MARISIKPIEPLELEFTDGTIKEALFNNEAFIIYSDEFGDFNDDTINEMKIRPYDYTAKILYCGMKVLDKTVTLEEARSIVVGGGEPLAMEIASLMIDNFMLASNEETKKKFTKELERINNQLLKQ